MSFNILIALLLRRLAVHWQPDKRTDQTGDSTGFT
jgi:hypothetical protein